MSTNEESFSFNDEELDKELAELDTKKTTAFINAFDLVVEKLTELSSSSDQSIDAYRGYQLVTYAYVTSTIATTRSGKRYVNTIPVLYRVRNPQTKQYIATLSLPQVYEKHLQTLQYIPTQSFWLDSLKDDILERLTKAKLPRCFSFVTNLRISKDHKLVQYLQTIGLVTSNVASSIVKAIDNYEKRTDCLQYLKRRIHKQEHHELAALTMLESLKPDDDFADL